MTKIDFIQQNENQPAEYVTLINPNNTGKNIHDKIFIGHYINVFYSTVDITLKTTTAILAKLMVYSAALTFFTANFHCNMTRKINEYA
ncbi:hypothetical protein DMH20_08480 [Escherichia coli]|nr:hypothetical protein [Escherichia coli]